MKKILSIFLLIALALGGTVKADELVVANDTWQKDQLPIDSYNCDASQHNQFIYPATELQAMKGAVISGIKFHTVNASYSWSSKGSPTFTFKFAEVEATTLSGFITDASFTQVYQGQAVFANNAWDITLDAGYTYNGGNLLIDVESPAAGFISTVKFYSAEYANAGCAKGVGNSYLPKATFTYESPVSGPGLKVLDGTTKINSGYSYSFGLATAGTTKTFTLSNPGTEEAPIAVAHTGSFEAVLSAASIPAGDEITLTVTMPDATGSDVITLSSTAESIEDFVINVSGSVRDASKFSETLLGGSIPEDWSTSGGTWSWNTTNGASNTAWYESSNYRLITPQLTVAEGEKFFFEVQGTYDGYQGIKLEYSTDKSSWTASATVPTITTDWQTIEINDVPAGKYYIALHGWHINVRNFYGGSVPSVPKNLEATATTANSATLSWTAAGSETAWKLQHSTDGENWSEEVAVAENPFELTGLSANTKYYVRIRADIASSEWSKVADFRTACAAVDALPYSENFEGHDLNAAPLCWDLLNAQSASISSYPFVAVYAQSGYYKDTKALFFRTNSAKVSYAIFPEFSFSLAKAEIAFSHKEESGIGTLVLGYMTDIADASTFVPLYECKLSSSWTDEEGISLATVTEGARLAFQHTVTSSYYDAAVDNITISLAPSCVKPTGLTISNEAAHSAQVEWASEATQWDLEYKLSSASDWTAAESVTNPFVLEGLDANAAYDVRVRNNCGESTSDWVEGSFNTPCEAKVLPFAEDFESGAFADCWSADSRWTINSNAHESSYCARYTSGAKGDLVLPSITLNDDAMLYYWHASSYPTGLVLVNGTSVQSITTTSGDWKKDSVDLSAYNGQTIVITFTSSYSTYSNRYLYIDDILVDYKPVAAPTNVVATPADQSATIIWASTEGTSWNLRYRVVGEEEWITENGLTATSKELTSLTNNANYEVQVQAVCSENRKSEWTASINFMPQACPNVTAVSLGIKTYQSVVVEWTTSGATNCDVRYSTDNGENWTIAQENIEESSATLGGLTVGTVYTIQVKPSCGNDETWVPAAETFNPVYTAPEADAASAISDKGATFSWSAVADAYSYEYAVTAREVAPAAWTEVAENTVSVNTLNAATEYDFFVRAKFADDGVSAYDSIGFATITLAPQNLQQDGESTTDGATFTWEANGAATQYQWSIDNTNWSAAQTAITATVEGLNPGSTYTFYVRSYYSESVQSAATSLSFDTQCATETLPFEQHFNSTSKPNCWTSDNWGASANNWSIDQYTDHTGESSYAASYSAKTNTANSAALVTPKVELSDAAILEFYYQNRYTSYYYSYAVKFDVVILDASDDSELRTKNYTEPSANNAWASDTLDLSAFVGKTIKVKFVGKGVGTSYTAYLKLDDVTITVKPCATPTELAAAASRGSAVVTWTDDEADTWNLRYKKTADKDWEYVNNLDVKSHTLNSLDEEAEYEVQVQAVCSTTRSSEWTESVNFTPACPTPGEIQFSNKTYNGVIVSWTAGGAETAWILEYNPGTGWTPVTENPLTTTSYTFDALETGKTYTFQVQAACGGDWTATANYTPQYSAPASASVTDATDVTATATWDAVADATNGYEYIVVARDAAEDWTSPIAVDETSASLTELEGLTEYDFYVRAVYGLNHGDATKAQFTTIAVEPKDVNNTEVTTNTATFIWDNAGAATKYQWSLDNSTWSEPFTGKTATVNGLTAGTSYTFYVRSYYAEEKVSSPISTPFSTECDVKALGWSEDFNKSTSMPNCWVADEQWTVAASSGVSSSNALRFKSGASANISLPATELTEEAVLRFSHSNGYVSGEIYVNAVDEEHKLADIARSSSWKSEEISLAAYTSQTITLIFRGLQNSNSYSMYIDNVSVIAKPCAAITSIDATAALDSVVLAWESDAEAFEYCVVESTAEAADWKATEEKSITVKGLTPEKAYTAYVRSSCSDTKKGEAKSATFTPECPAPTALTVGEVTTTTATFSWTAAAGISKYQYKLGSEAWDDENVVEGTNLELTNLDPATEYTLYVRSYYNAEAQSKTYLTKSFATACGAQPLTFEEDFSGAITCWTLENCHKSTGVTGGEFMFNYNSNPPQYLISPELVPSEKKATVEFEYRARGTSYEESFQVGYSLTTNDTTAFVWSDTTFCSVTDKQKYSEKLPASVKYVAIRYTANNKWALYIDNFSVAEYVPTAIDLVGTGADGEKVIKLIENDQLVIIRDGIKYNAQGKRLGE